MNVCLCHFRNKLLVRDLEGKSPLHLVCPRRPTTIGQTRHTGNLGNEKHPRVCVLEKISEKEKSNGAQGKFLPVPPTL